jgi:hypothetical protein
LLISALLTIRGMKMRIGIRSIGFVTAVLTSVSFAFDAVTAIAQTTYPFSASYDTRIDIVPIGADLSQSIELATTDKAPYGLTQYQGLIYAQADPITGGFKFNTDPVAFGLSNLPSGYITFTGEGTDNKLYGSATASAIFDLENLTGQGFGVLTITGGEGLFAGATGTLDFSEVDQLNPDPNILSINGKAQVNGAIEAVPEPGSELGTLVGTGSLIGATLLLRRRRSVV